MRWTIVFLFLSLSAQETPHDDLEPLLRLALQRNPEILAARARLAAARQRPTIEGSLPDPMISVGYTSVNGPLPGQGLGAFPTATIGVMASQRLPAAGKLRLRAAIARREATGIEQEYWLTELTVLSRLKAAWHKLHHAYSMLDLLEQDRQLLDRLTTAAELRYANGQASQQDVLKAQMQTILLEARCEKYEQERDSRAAEINAILARPFETPLPRPTEAEPHEALASLEELLRAAGAHAPALQRERAAVERAEQSLNLARKEGAIDYTVGAAWASMGSMGSMYQAKLDFNLPQFTRRRQQAAVLEQLNERDRARRSYQATGNQVMYQIKDDWLQSQTAWRLMQLYSTTLLPQAKLMLEASMNAYQNGQTDMMNVLMNMMAVLDAEMAYHEELMNHYLALLRMEESTGVPLLAEDAPAGHERGEVKR